MNSRVSPKLSSMLRLVPRQYGIGPKPRLIKRRLMLERPDLLTVPLHYRLRRQNGDTEGSKRTFRAMQRSSPASVQPGLSLRWLRRASIALGRSLRSRLRRYERYSVGLGGSYRPVLPKICSMRWPDGFSILP
jgi:hypothetical protein